MYKKFVITIFVLLFSAMSLLAQSTGTIRGTAISSDNTPLEGVNVFIKGTKLGAATDVDGNFFISTIPAGIYQVTASRVGFEKVILTQIKVKPSLTTEINFILQQQPINLEKVTITAMRQERKISEVPVAIEIISSKKIAQVSAQNTGEVLSSFSSVTMKGTSDLNSLQTISLRGSTDSQVLVLLDGQRLNNSQNASVDFSTIPVEFVDKIEIVKGGHSAFYGTNAVGGVINIISKSSPVDQKISAGIKSGVGSWNSQFHTVNMSQQIGKFNYFAVLNTLRSNGKYSYRNNEGNKQDRENNDIEKNEVFVKANYLVTEKSQLHFFTSYGKWDRGLPGPISFPSTTQRLKETRKMYNVGYENATFDSWQFKANVYYHWSNQNYRDSSPYAAEDTEHKNEAIGFNFQNRYMLNNWLQISYGYDFRQDKLASTKYNKRSRDIQGIYFIGEVKTSVPVVPVFNKIIFVPAFRYDKYTDFDGQVSPKLGVVITHSSDASLSLRGNVGSSFRAPTFNDLFWPVDTWSVGNPDLKPEKGLNYDLGLLAEFNQGTWLTNLEFSYFVNDIENLNMWKEVSPWFWQPQNIDKSLTRGTEVQFKFSFLENLLNLRAAHTYLDAKYHNDDSPLFGNYLEYRPKHKVDIGIGVDYTFANMNIIYRHLDKSFKDENNIQMIPPSNLFDANITINHKLANVNVVAKFDIINIFDKQFVTFGDQPIPGRQLRFSLGVQY